MRGILKLIGISCGGAFGWWLGSFAGPMTAVLLAALGSGAGAWAAGWDVREWLAQASVFVLPSWREGLPRSTQEAMALARPVITTDAPGCRETVREGENGFLVQPGSVDSLEAALLRFVTENGLAEAMGHRSREIAEGKYDVRAVNAQMLREMGLA